MTTKSALITLLVLTAFIGLTVQQIPRCLLSRLDFLPCQYINPLILRASLRNEYSEHRTSLRVTSSGSIECNVRSLDQRITPIRTLGSREFKVIESPGFILSQRYPNSFLVQYNIHCEEGEHAAYDITFLDIQGAEDCFYNGRPRCQDYILIDRGEGGTTEICGNSTTDNNTFLLDSNNFTVFFRTSEVGRFQGFKMNIACLGGDSACDMQGCLDVAKFSSCWCNCTGDCDFSCTASGFPEVEIDCSGIAPDTSLQCSFDSGPLHSCNLPMVFTRVVSPPGNYSVRIVASTGEDTVHYIITDTDPSIAAKVPQLEVILSSGYPRVTGSSVEAEFTTTRPVAGATCFLRYQNKRDYKDCSSGRVFFTGLRPGRYVLKISAYNKQTDVATAKSVVTV